MADWQDVERIAMALPETEGDARGEFGWSVRGKVFAWDRPLRKSDLEALGPGAPTGLIMCASVPELAAKDALIAEDPDIYFTTPHFNGFRGILVRLERIGVEELEELLVEAWLARAPKRLAQQYLAERTIAD